MVDISIIKFSNNCISILQIFALILDGVDELPELQPDDYLYKLIYKNNERIGHITMTGRPHRAGDMFTEPSDVTHKRLNICSLPTEQVQLVIN